MRWIAASILVLAIVIAVVGWRLTTHHKKHCGGAHSFCYQKPF